MNTDSESWKRAKSQGDAAELVIAEWFRQRGYDVYKAVGSTEPDLSVHTTVEVKRDLAAARTGNVALEVAYRNQPSGLRTTTAVWWAVVTADTAYLAKVRDVRQWLDRSDYPARPSGDGKRSLCVLVPVADFRKQDFVHELPIGELSDAA